MHCTKYIRCGTHGFREDFKCFSSLKVMEGNVPSVWPIYTTGTWLAGFMNGNTRNCYMLNILVALGLKISETIFNAFPISSLWKLMTLGMVILDPS